MTKQEEEIARETFIRMTSEAKTLTTIEKIVVRGVVAGAVDGYDLLPLSIRIRLARIGSASEAVTK